MKIKHTKFPFPWAQLIALMIFVLTIWTPFLVTASAKTYGMASFMSFLPVFGVVSLNLVAIELEMPFGNDKNDLPLSLFQSNMNAALIMLLHPKADHIAGTSETAKKSFDDLIDGERSRKTKDSIKELKPYSEVMLARFSSHTGTAVFTSNLPGEGAQQESMDTTDEVPRIRFSNGLDSGIGSRSSEGEYWPGAIDNVEYAAPKYSEEVGFTTIPQIRIKAASSRRPLCSSTETDAPGESSDTSEAARRPKGVRLLKKLGEPEGSDENDEFAPRGSSRAKPGSCRPSWENLDSGLDAMLQLWTQKAELHVEALRQNTRVLTELTMAHRDSQRERSTRSTQETSSRFNVNFGSVTMDKRKRST
uniref:Uncharacterized protein n=1 Tax=Zooxanthella nutricula TaxID=1333877 RepID=A0A7S2LJA4_9DINO